MRSVCKCKENYYFHISGNVVFEKSKLYEYYVSPYPRFIISSGVGHTYSFTTETYERYFVDVQIDRDKKLKLLCG
jgi:hypothetical protein